MPCRAALLAQKLSFLLPQQARREGVRRERAGKAPLQALAPMRTFALALDLVRGLAWRLAQGLKY